MSRRRLKEQPRNDKAVKTYQCTAQPKNKGEGNKIKKKKKKRNSIRKQNLKYKF